MQNSMLPVRLLLALNFILTFPLLLSAQEASARSSGNFLDSENGVTEPELLARALASNPRLAALRQEIAIARGGVAQARLRANPSLSVGGLKEVDGEDDRFSIGGAVPLELFGRRARRTEVAERKLNATQATVANEERLLTGEVRMRFAQTVA